MDRVCSTADEYARLKDGSPTDGVKEHYLLVYDILPSIFSGNATASGA